MWVDVCVCVCVCVCLCVSVCVCVCGVTVSAVMSRLVEWVVESDGAVAAGAVAQSCRGRRTGCPWSRRMDVQVIRRWAGSVRVCAAIGRVCVMLWDV